MNNGCIDPPEAWADEEDWPEGPVNPTALIEVTFTTSRGNPGIDLLCPDCWEENKETVYRGDTARALDPEKDRGEVETWACDYCGKEEVA